MTAVSRLDLDKGDRDRLREVVVQVTKAGPRADFSATCLLAKRLWNTELEEQLVALATVESELAAPVEQLLQKRYTHRPPAGQAAARRPAPAADLATVQRRIDAAGR